MCLQDYYEDLLSGKTDRHDLIIKRLKERCVSFADVLGSSTPSPSCLHTCNTKCWVNCYGSYQACWVASIEWFLWTIEHTNRSLDNLKQRFAHHGLCQAYIACLTNPMMGKWTWWVKRCMNYQVNCWCARSSKGTILYCWVNCQQKRSILKYVSLYIVVILYTSIRCCALYGSCPNPMLYSAINSMKFTIRVTQSHMISDKIWHCLAPPPRYCVLTIDCDVQCATIRSKKWTPVC